MKEITLKIKFTHPDSKHPIQATPEDACWDVFSTELKNTTDLYLEYGTGLSMAIPEDHVGLLFPRSSVSNYALNMANCVGVIDAGYRGEVTVRFRRDCTYFDGDLDIIGKVYKVGDKIAQLMVIERPRLKLEVVEDLPASIRGRRGYGSSGT